MLLFNATDPEKQTQLCIQKADTNSCLGELAPLRATKERQFSGSDKKEDDRKVTATNPAAERRKRNIALPSEEEAVNKRQTRGYSDYRFVQTAVIAVFLAASVGTWCKYHIVVTR